MTRADGEGSFRDQLLEAAGQSSPIPERADVMARALYALKFADRWLAEQVEEESVAMRGGAGQLRRTYTLTGRNVELVIESGVERRITGAVEPIAEGWVSVRAGTHGDQVRIDADGMFTATIPSGVGPIDLVLEFDDGERMVMRGVV